MILSQHFSLEEFLTSETATKCQIDNTPSDEIINNLTSLCLNILEPIRNNFKSPVLVLSGYRCEELNRLVAGSSNSQHLTGEAADICVRGVRNDDLYKFIRSSLPFDQLIAERLIRDKPYSGWVHVSYSKDKNRHMALSGLGAGQYYNGLFYIVDNDELRNHVNLIRKNPI